MDYSSAVISDRLQALTRRLDSDPALPGRLRIFSAPKPSPGGLPGAATELATLSFPKPSLQGVVGKVLTLLAPPTTLIGATGDAFWGRLEAGSGEWVGDGLVGLIEDGVVTQPGDFLIVGDSVRLFAGGELTVLVAKLQEV